ncbi:DUF3574 domain-containing protein [Pantoea stewartii]|uniref:DUF3574 domain-containing protein n=1 Tax=Pantoea stewartii TaxID=66269 RepID=UPI001F4D08E6|nr:DUF3574 domain-containing protein [Pantoea stewartii]
MILDLSLVRGISFTIFVSPPFIPPGCCLCTRRSHDADFSLRKPQGGSLSPQDWINFVDKEVTPRFSAGLSYHDAQTLKPEGGGRSVRDSSMVLALIYQFDMDTSNRVEALRTLYKNGSVRRQSCSWTSLSA